jgi:hypothetical protein
MDTCMQIPEIKEDNAYIKHTTHGKRVLFPMIYGDPDKEHPYYWVVVGENNGMCFVTHFTFYVYQKSGKILFYDRFNEKAMDLPTWRKRCHGGSDFNCPLQNP